MVSQVVYEKGRTGFEERKDYLPEIGALVAGRYRVQSACICVEFGRSVGGMGWIRPSPLDY